MQPVNKLPPEILSYVARRVRNNLDEDTRAIIPLTHVCRYWRESIISTPENWKVISNSRRNLATASLERSKSALLEIRLDMGGIREDPQFFDLLVPHLQHTEILRVTGLLTIEDLSLFSLHQMTNLRSLELSRQLGVRDWDRSIDPFELSAYTLRHLKLFFVPLYPSFLNFRSLKRLDLCDRQCNLHLDTLLDFLEENRSLTIARLGIRFVEPSVRASRRRAPIQNRLRYLDITCGDAIDGQALISSIALSKGAQLKLDCSWYIGPYGVGVGVGDVLSGISTSHLSNLLSPTFMQYRIYPKIIHLRGPNGTATFHSKYDLNIPFAEFPRLPLANIRLLHLDTGECDQVRPSLPLIPFDHLSFFPAIETFIASGTDLSRLLSTLLSDRSASPSLKTLMFTNWDFTEEFMEGLTRFASDRKKTTSARLHRVVITNRGGVLPSIASIHELEKHVPVVDVRIAEEPPSDL